MRGKKSGGVRILHLYSRSMCESIDIALQIDYRFGRVENGSAVSMQLLNAEGFQRSRAPMSSLP